MRKLQAILFATVRAAVLAGSLYTAHLNAAQDTSAASSAAPSPATQSAQASGSGSSGSSGSPADSSGTLADSGSGTSGGSSTSRTSPSTSSSGLQDGTFTGSAASTQYGDVQVKVTVKNGKISDVAVPVYPNSERRDVEIAQRSIPTLVSETLSKQSAKVSMVTGATFTSEGYRQSLQSALDKAGA